MPMPPNVSPTTPTCFRLRWRQESPFSSMSPPLGARSAKCRSRLLPNLDSGLFSTFAASLLLVLGIVLVVPVVQARLSLAIAPLGNWVEQGFGGPAKKGLKGQFAVGMLLGAVWTPCVGPTLGAASVLAAQGRDLVQVALTMFVFAVGTALPLLFLGLLSREAIMCWRGRLLTTGTTGKMALGLVLIATGALVLTGFDKPLEA